jgi:hypothetical protein
MAKQILLAGLLVICTIAGAGYSSFRQFQHAVAQNDLEDRVAGYDKCVQALGADPAGIKTRQDCYQFWLHTPHSLANGWKDWLGID